MIPTNIVIASAAIISIVAAAFFDSGGLNAGTPFDTASTPVIAVQPFENAVSSRNSVSAWPVDGTGAAATTGETSPIAMRHTPTPMRIRIETTKKYVGSAKIRPDSLMPRRLPTISTSTNPSVASTGRMCHWGNADVTAATPAAMLTATVST